MKRKLTTARHRNLPAHCPSELAGAVMALVVLTSTTLPLPAHTPITTRYRFDPDVRAVLEKHCVRCHSPGGPTPMSLRTHKETRPWAESIKEQLLERNMPPLFVEHGSVRVQNGSPLTARELDVLVDWASGGAPEGSPRVQSKSEAAIKESSPSPGVADPAGDAEPTRAPVEPDTEWTVSEFRDFMRPVDQDKTELRVSHRTQFDDTVYLAGWSLESAPRWLRSASLWIEGSRTAGVDSRKDSFLGSWVAGDEPFLFPRDSGFKVHAGLTLRVDARYKRTWLLRSRKLEPRTRLRLRLTKRPPRQRVISVSVPLETREAALLAADATALAFFPSAPDAGKLLLEHEASPRVLLDLFRVSEEWPVMYRFTTAEPLTGRLVWQPEGQPTGAAVGGYALYVTDR